MSTRSGVDRLRQTRWGRLAVALVVLTSTAVTAQYASANFGSAGTTVPQGNVAAARLTLTLGGDATQPFQTTISPIYPGLFFQRLLDINIGASTLKTVSVYPADVCGGCASSLLSSDATNGLTLGVERCTVPWGPPIGTAPNQIYLCSDSAGGALGGTQLIANLTPFANVRNAWQSISTGLSSFTLNTTYYYTFYFQLPNGTAVTTQGLTSTLAFYFTGTQRDATAK